MSSVHSQFQGYLCKFLGEIRYLKILVQNNISKSEKGIIIYIYIQLQICSKINALFIYCKMFFKWRVQSGYIIAFAMIHCYNLVIFILVCLLCFVVIHCLETASPPPRPLHWTAWIWPPTHSQESYHTSINITPGSSNSPQVFNPTVNTLT